MGDRVLKKIVSDVMKHCCDREYVPCYKLDSMSAATLKRLVLRKKRCNLFSRLIKGPYKYMLLDFSLGDYGVLIASGEAGDYAAGDPSLLDDESLFTERFLGSCALSSVTTTVSSPRVDTLEVSVNVGAGLDRSASTPTSHFALRVSQINGTNMKRLILELQKQWRFDKEHRFWKQISGEDKYQLCFISRIVLTKEELTLHYQRRRRGCVKASHLENKRSNIPKCCLVIPAGATFAYDVQQLKIDPSSGRITVPLGNMATSGDDDTPINSKTEVEDCRK